MTVYEGNIIRLFGEPDYHEVIGIIGKSGYEELHLSDGRFVKVSDVEYHATPDDTDWQSYRTERIAEGYLQHWQEELLDEGDDNVR